jgi:hypothetical protein
MNSDPFDVADATNKKKYQFSGMNTELQQLRFRTPCFSGWAPV